MEGVGRGGAGEERMRNTDGERDSTCHQRQRGGEKWKNREKRGGGRAKTRRMIREKKDLCMYNCETSLVHWSHTLAVH